MQEKTKNNKFVQKKIKKEKNNKNNKGITLIALVITIIVLIILAGISINLVLGKNGIFNKAKQAAEEYKQAAIDEQKMTNDLEEGIEKIANDNRPKTIQEAKEKNYGYFYEKTTLEDSDGNKVVVPIGFKIAEDSGDNVTEGIVIEDKDITTDGNGKQRGNQYVWIPVSNIDGSDSNPIKKSDNTDVVVTLGRYEFADGTESYPDDEGNPMTIGQEILRQTAENYTDETEEILIGSSYKELATYREGKESLGTDGENRTAKELEKFIESVRQNGGYYIARYEASYGEDGKANSKISTSYSESSVPTQEGTLWNYITQIKAAEACEGMYTTVESDLINSYAWDTAVLYIQKFSGDTDYSMQDGKSISINNGLTNTGKNSNDEVCKIHDMASNCFEWTTENSTYTVSSSAEPCVNRGGYCTGSGDYASHRGDSSAPYSSRYCTFRPTLYISTPES